MSDRDTTRDLMARLRRHYIKPGAPLPGGVFLEEVGFNGFGTQNRADAIWVGFTSASGRKLVGHEVKASRADWLKELDSPGKADAWADQCHQWFVVAAPGIVKREELPDGWGLMQPGRSKTRMEVVVPARTVLDRVPSWDATRSLLSRYDTLRAEEIHHAKQKAQQDVHQQIQEGVQRGLAARDPSARAEQRAQEILQRLAKTLGFAAIEDYSWDERISVDHLDAALGRWVRADRDVAVAAEQLLSRYGAGHLDTIRRNVTELEKALAALREPAAKGAPA